MGGVKLRAMAEKPTQCGGGAGVVIAIVVVLVVLPILYVLSIGPTFGMIANGWVSPTWAPTAVAAYRPLEWIARCVPSFGQAVTQYTQWWLPPPPVSTPPPPAMSPAPAPAPAGS